MSPIGKIALRLRRRWSADEAQVLADWCEEHGLVGMAKQLRRGPSARARSYICELCPMLGSRQTMFSLTRPATMSLGEWIDGSRNT